MNKAKFVLLAASLLFAILFPLSCSSGGNDPDPGPPNKPASVIGCKIAGQCTAVLEEALCTQMQGTIDNSCSFKGCTIAGTCTVIEAGLAEQGCTAAGGTVGAICPVVFCKIGDHCSLQYKDLCYGEEVASCDAGGGGSSSSGSGAGNSCAEPGWECIEGIPREICEYFDMTFSTSPCNISLYPICLDENENCTTVTAANKAACFAGGGSLISNEAAPYECNNNPITTPSSSSGGGNPVGSCTYPGQACFEGNRNECEWDFAAGGTCNLTTFPICWDEDENCTTATAANKASCFARDGLLVTRGFADEWCNTPTPSSSSGGGTNTPVAYCDFGLPNSSGGGCFPIYTASDFGTCDTDYAITAVRCGTQTQTFCRWTTGCWETTSASACTTDYGTSVTECSPSEYQHPMYCLDPNANGGPTCSRIAAGSWYTGARACLSNVGSSAAIVERSFCENAEVTIRD